MIRLGVAGWDYPDWSGIVYPAEARGRFDRLAWIARFVDVVEINATFYRQPAPATARSWCRRVEPFPRFRFTAKAHRDWTHGPPDRVGRAIAETLNGLEPLRDAGRLLAILVQFPQSFAPGAPARERLEAIREGCGDWPWALEVRHRGWERARTRDWLQRHRVAWCCIDQPRASRSTIGLVPWRTAPLAYARFHGRNVREWFSPDTDRDRRYDHLYSHEETAALAGALRPLADAAEEFVAIHNNHFRGQALANSLQLAHALSGARPRAPEELVRLYPALEPSVVVERRTLF